MKIPAYGSSVYGCGKESSGSDCCTCCRKNCCAHFFRKVYYAAVYQPAVAFKKYSNLWNLLDMASLSLAGWVAIRLLFHFDRDYTTTIAAINTTLLWMRMINYLSGPQLTAPYVRMFTAITFRMMTFLIMLLVFVTGNAFVLLLLFPSVCTRHL
eukprot:COSAG01_NODE_15556_length_1324_cov_1.168163_2_plen_154_part_00